MTKYLKEFPGKSCLRFFAAVILYFLFALVLCYFTNGRHDYFEQNKLMIFCAFSWAFICYFWHRDSKVLGLSCATILLYASTAYIKILAGMPLNGVEILDVFGLGTIIFCVTVLLHTFLQIRSNKILQDVNLVIFYTYILVILLVPLLLWGYFFVSGGHLLTSDIILTVFQTNFGEAVAYLKEQQMWKWLLALGIMALWLITNIKLINLLPAWRGNKKVLAGITLFIIYVAAFIMPKMQDCYAMNIFLDTQGQLSTYSAYREAKTEREQRLKQLQGLGIKDEATGIYVLVIGEAETRNHMSAYGYARPTTPWLTGFAREPGTILFQNAYSCHTHTIPVLTYALSEKNQYNKINLPDAYSIMEVAKAAGYTTYWISNQLKYGIWDTPLAEIASTADHQYWLNGNVGKTTKTLYLDEKIAQVLQKINLAPKAFVVCHVMGSHVT